MNRYLPIVAILGFLTLLIGGCGLQGYNRVVTMDENVEAAWAQVENQLQRRYDLIPNLVETVKGIAAQEKDVFIGVAEARNQFNKAGNVNQKAAAASLLESALGRLIAVREDYPELKSNESFLKLQDQLEGTENRISVERGRYNETARDLNGYIRALPGRIWASLAGVERAEYFNVSNEDAKEAPNVTFAD
ncbi:LemA family protein [Rubripirellula lacrimiformis]|uniref:LemA family protein n=1 Tax=Rubripirellula lacrimiformis TaxID=1930273 RepID=A0A517N4I8_9BACT|nr:LemA family protein [Rubripirellula lacrimiformis]QDT02043.1 LemA family protein [Rubripirellula lacrimiformis]